MTNVEIANVLETIKSNEKLLDFNRHIVNYMILLNDNQFKYAFLASLVSADTLVSIDNCKRSKSVLEFLEKYIDLIINDEQERKRMLPHIQDAIIIVQTEMDNFSKNLEAQ